MVCMSQGTPGATGGNRATVSTTCRMERVRDFFRMLLS
jgi:hypothetical protein